MTCEWVLPLLILSGWLTCIHRHCRTGPFGLLMLARHDSLSVCRCVWHFVALRISDSSFVIILPIEPYSAATGKPFGLLHQWSVCVCVCMWSILIRIRMHCSRLIATHRVALALVLFPVQLSVLVSVFPWAVHTYCVLCRLCTTDLLACWCIAAAASDDARCPLDVVSPLHFTRNRMFTILIFVHTPYSPLTNIIPVGFDSKWSCHQPYIRVFPLSTFLLVCTITSHKFAIVAADSFFILLPVNCFNLHCATQ